MKEVLIRFIAMIENEPSITIAVSLLLACCVLIVSITRYNIASDKAMRDAQRAIYVSMAEHGYSEVQTAGSCATHWEKK